jgi:two-component system, response regulator YesN
MSYKVFLVEDEIVTREGIRDNVDWKANGFEFCGEAPDGEIALPLLQTARPDLLITDIRMPFMDGLQLCKIVRERMPWVKIIILSGHDEFEYAQKAIGLGVTEYLLKPVTVQNLHSALQKIAVQLDQERKEQQHLRKLQDDVEENRAALRERLLLRLVVGAISSTDAIEKAELLGLDIIARYYLVVIIRIEQADRSAQFDYAEYQHIQQMLTGLVEHNPDLLILKKGWDELVLIIKGNTPEYLEEEKESLLERVKREVQQPRYHLVIGAGTLKKRIAEISLSFVEALARTQTVADAEVSLNYTTDKAELLKLDRSAVENYLKCGVKEEFDEFFDAYIQPLHESAIESHLIKNYMFVDIVLATAKLVNELGGDVDQIIPDLDSVEMMLTNIKTTEQLHEQARKMLISALAFRDSRTSNHAGIVQQAKQYIDRHYVDPDLSLNQVAAQVNLSASYFSVVFGQSTGQTFKEYLTEIRIKKAKELLRMTTQGTAEISYQVGYSDPHYFSYVFRKNTGLSPTQFRLQAQARS